MDRPYTPPYLSLLYNALHLTLQKGWQKWGKYHSLL
jgi:hypothetical protein